MKRRRARQAVTARQADMKILMVGLFLLSMLSLASGAGAIGVQDNRRALWWAVPIWTLFLAVIVGMFVFVIGWNPLCT